MFYLIIAFSSLFSAVVDLIFRGRGFGPWKIGGTVLIVFGFLIMLMPERWQEKAYCCKSSNSLTLNVDEEAANNDSGIDNPTMENNASKKEEMNGKV